MTRWLVSATFFILAILSLIPLVAAIEIGKYRASFEKAKIEFNKINESLSYMNEVNESAIEELRGRIAHLKSELNITDLEKAKERVEVEKTATEALRNKVSNVESQKRAVLLAVFGNFGALTGFWAAFFVYRILRYKRQR